MRTSEQPTGQGRSFPPEVNARQRDAPSGAVRVCACLSRFGIRPEVRVVEATLRIEDAVNETCPWSGKPIAADSLTRYAGAIVGFCNPGCRDKFEAATRHFESALAGRRMEASMGGTTE